MREMKEEEHIRWESVVARTLSLWIADPSLLQAEEIDPPDQSLIEKVKRFSLEKLGSQFPAPDRVLPNGDSGVAFEWDDGVNYTCLEFKKDDTIEVVKTDGDQIVRQRSLLEF